MIIRPIAVSLPSKAVELPKDEKHGSKGVKHRERRSRRQEAVRVPACWRGQDYFRKGESASPIFGVTKPRPESELAVSESKSF